MEEEEGGVAAAGFKGDFPLPFPLLGEEARLADKSNVQCRGGRRERRREGREGERGGEGREGERRRGR